MFGPRFRDVYPHNDRIPMLYNHVAALLRLRSKDRYSHFDIRTHT